MPSLLVSRLNHRHTDVAHNARPVSDTKNESDNPSYPSRFRESV